MNIIFFLNFISKFAEMGIRVIFSDGYEYEYVQNYFVNTNTNTT